MASNTRNATKLVVPHPIRNAPVRSSNFSQELESDHEEDTEYADEDQRASSIMTNPAERMARAKVMKQFLNQLRDAAMDLWRHLLTPQDDRHTWYAQARIRVDVFESYESNYRDEGFYIQDHAVLGTLRSQNQLPEVPNPAHVVLRSLFQANMATLLREVTMPSVDRLTALQALDDVFPMCSPEDLGLDQAGVFEQALDIRTQLLIAHLRESHTVLDSSAAIAHFFCEPDARQPKGVDKLLENGSYKDLGGLSLSQKRRTAFRAQYRRRIEELKSIMSNHERHGALGSLEAVFPFETFRSELVEWGDGCLEAIHGSGRDSPTAFVDALEDIDSQHESDLASQQIVRSGTVASGDNVVRSRGAILHLQARESHLQGSPPSHQDERLSQAGSNSPLDYGTISNKAIIRNAQRSLTSQQPPSSSWTSRDANRHIYHTSAASQDHSKKHVRISEESNDEGEDEFEQDSRVPLSQKKPLSAAPASTSYKRVRIDDSATPDVPSSRARVLSAGVGASRSSLAPTASGSTNFDLEALSQKVKAATPRNHKTSGPQMRTRWDGEDVDQLIRAVEEYECRWAKIEEDANKGVLIFNHPRDQQAFRDKARLLKQDFLKADVLLPPGFDRVVLGPKERRAVIACGKNPDRKEYDIDENGNPIDTLHVHDPFASD